MRDVILLGGGGLSRELIGYSSQAKATGDGLSDPQPLRIVGILDDGMAAGDVVAGVPVLGGMADATRVAEDADDARFVLAVSAPHTYKHRPDIVRRAGLPRDRYATYVMLGAHVVPSARVGAGVVLFPGVVIGTDAVLEDHVQVWPNAVISHDCRVGQYATVASSASLNGGVNIASGAYIGSGALIREGSSVGTNALVGMGAVVLSDVGAGQVVVGNPARYLRDG